MTFGDLGRHTDVLTEALRDAEDALDEMQTGVSAKVPLGPEHHLSWEKTGSDWGLVVYLSNGETQPLINSSRRLRIMAPASLHALHSEILSEYAKQDRDVVEATRKVKMFAEYVRARK